MIVYQILGLYFHLRSYASVPKKADDHLAAIVNYMSNI